MRGHAQAGKKTSMFIIKKNFDLLRLLPSVKIYLNPIAESSVNLALIVVDDKFASSAVLSKLSTATRYCYVKSFPNCVAAPKMFGQQ